MKQSKKNAFTLMELVAVLVIMAIIALIVTPLVMSIIRKTRISADKRSIDAYGRSIELAIAGYLMDNGSFPTNIDQLTIEYSGDEVGCSTTQINPDSSVYLAGCKVNNRDVTNYTYGSDKSPSYNAYEVGDEVTYNGVDYYVLKDSGTKESTVTLLKAEPLLYEEVENYCADIDLTISDHNGYGGIKYHSVNNDYSKSFVKKIIDAWAIDSIPRGLRESRLITFDEVISLGFERYSTCDTCSDMWVKTEETPIWMYNNLYTYWTLSAYNDSDSKVWTISDGGSLSENGIGSSGRYGYPVVRPVIVLDKSVL